jgi:hypothetical protein
MVSEQGPESIQAADLDAEDPEHVNAALRPFVRCKPT